MNHDTKGLEMTHSRNAWIALFLVVFGLAIPVLWVLVTGSAPRTGNPIQLLFILLLIIGFSLSVGALRLWPARIAFGLCCLVVIGSFASNAMRPNCRWVYSPDNKRIALGLRRQAADGWRWFQGRIMGLSPCDGLVILSGMPTAVYALTLHREAQRDEFK